MSSKLYRWFDAAQQISNQNKHSPSKAAILAEKIILAIVNGDITPSDASGLPLSHQIEPPFTVGKGPFIEAQDVQAWLDYEMPSIKWKPKKLRTKMIEQEDAVLKILQHLEHDPLSIPANPKGKPGVKKEVWTIAKSNKDLFSSHNVFTDVWERLQAYKLIKSTPIKSTG